MNGWLIFLGLLGAYLLVLYAMRSRGGKAGGAEVNGPFIMWRTQFGKATIEKVATPRRFWEIVADVGIALTWLTGIAIFALLLYQLTLYFSIPEIVAESGQSPQFLIGLPGVNPLIPLWYGLIALIIALVVHEGSHGVMAYVARMRVKSLGLLFFIVPIGAFVEPDEEDLERATAREKNRVFAAGPSSNLFLALVAGIILSTAFLANLNVANDGEGVGVGNVLAGTAAESAGLRNGDILVAFRDVPLHNVSAENMTLLGIAAPTPPEPDPADDGNATADDAGAGAASNDTAEPQPIVTNVTVTNSTVYLVAMAHTRAGDNLTVVYVRDGETLNANLTLGDRFDYLARTSPTEAAEDDEGRGFMGITPVGLQLLSNIKNILQNPFASGFPQSFAVGGPTTPPGSFFIYIAYPFIIFQTGIDILAPPYSQFFTIDGPLAGLPPVVFFGLATLLYWIVWLDLMLGTFNALPAGPLDGGQMLRATLRDRLMRRYKVNRSDVEVERVEMGGAQLRGRTPETQAKLDRIQHVLSRTTWTLGLFILGLILLPLFGPPLMKLLVSG